jgi:exopolysaccharide production protein ExoZ
MQGDRGMTDTRYFGGVDVVRFLSALVVMAFHLCSITPVTMMALAPGQILHRSPADPFWFGWVGVEIFFVISGLVIANSAASSTPLAFAKNRACRLYPSAWICATTSLLILLALGGRPWLFAQYASSMLLLPINLRISGVYWSLAVEIVFYALVFLWRARLPNVPLQKLASCLLIWSGLYLVAMSAGYLLPGEIARPIVLVHGAYFAIGILLWLRTQRRWTLLEALQFAAACGFGLLQILARARSMGGGRHWPELLQNAALPAAVWVIAIGAICLSTLSRATPTTPEAARGSVRRIGLMTYPIYLVHDVLGGAVVVAELNAGHSRAVAVTVGMCCVIAFSFLTVTFGELPLRRALRQGLERIEAYFPVPALQPASTPPSATQFD